MSPSAHQVNEALRGALLAALRPGPGSQEEIDSILHRAGATLYSLMADYPVNQRGRCRSCRGPGTVLGLRRRRCRVHGKAQMWLTCTVCVISRITDATVAGTPSGSGPDSADTVGLAADGDTCREWGWPVTLHHDQVHLSLEHHVAALAIPTPLCAEVLTILTQRRCTPPVLAHPYAPEHHIMLTGEQYGLPLPWPAQVHQITGVLLLPPTFTPRGPITRVRTPQPDSLRLCREIDLFAALRDAGPR